MDGSFQPKEFRSAGAAGGVELGEEHVASYLRGDGHASHCHSVSAGCLFQH